MNCCTHKHRRWAAIGAAMCLAAVAGCTKIEPPLERTNPFDPGGTRFEPVDPHGNDEVIINIEPIGDIAPGSPKPVFGAVVSNPALEALSAKVVDTAGNEIVDGGITVTHEDVAGMDLVDLDIDAHMVVAVEPTACNGRYGLLIEGVAGAATTRRAGEFYVTGATDCPTGTALPLSKVAVTLGSWENATHGSCLDLKTMDVYGVHEVTVDVEPLIDVFYATDPMDVPTLWSPRAAAEAQYAGVQDWQTLHETHFARVTVDFDTIRSVTAIRDLWPGTGKQKLVVGAGDVVVAKTASGSFHLLRIVSAENSSTGTAVVEGLVR